jgi:hypothetical protein
LHINPSESIAGVSGLIARDVLKAAARRGRLNTSQLPWKIRREVSNREELLDQLTAAGYLRRKGDEWVPTPAGLRLATAVASKPIKRGTARALLEEFVSRIEQLNSDPYYIYFVLDAVVFGSTLGGAEHVGDVDVAVRLEPRYDGAEHLDVRRLRIKAETQQFNGSDLHDAGLPEREVFSFLRGSSSSIKIHGVEEVLKKEFPYRVLYQSDYVDVGLLRSSPELARPFQYRPGAALMLQATSPTDWDGTHFNEGDHIYVRIKESWRPEDDGGPWAVPADSFPESWLPEAIRPKGGYSINQLTRVSESVVKFPSDRILFHVRLDEARARFKNWACPECGKRVVSLRGRGRRPEPAFSCGACGLEERFPGKISTRAEAVEISHTARECVGRALSSAATSGLLDRGAVVAAGLERCRKRILLSDYSMTRKLVMQSLELATGGSNSLVSDSERDILQELLDILIKAKESDTQVGVLLRVYKSKECDAARKGDLGSKVLALLAASSLASAREKCQELWESAHTLMLTTAAAPETTRTGVAGKGNKGRRKKC